MQVHNPAWKLYNDVQNEGGDGYNPHRRFLGGTCDAAEVLDCTSAPLGAWPGRPISRAEAQYLLSEERRLLQDAESRAKYGDLCAAVAIDGITSRVAHYVAQLAK